MKSKKLKKLLAIAIVGTMVSTTLPVTASAAWLKDSQGNWSFAESGNKATGWKLVDGTWYHFDANGKMQTGWVQTVDSKWYYLNANGGMKTGWLKDTNGKWYFLTSSGEMKTGWLLDNDGKWYFTDVSGAMQTGVIEVQGKLYALEASGAMAKGTTVIGGVTYTIDGSGVLTGDKLPTPEKAFTNEGKAKVNNSAENAGTTSTQNNSATSTQSSSSSSSKNSSSNNSSSSNSSNNNSSNNNSSSDNSSNNNSSNNNSSTKDSSSIITGQDLSCDQAGTYGPASGIVEVNNVSVNAPGVILKNMHIKGDLVLGEGIGEGDISLDNVTVDGTTTVKGGGENSIHFINSILATVIVNKNDGRIRIVVEGHTQVAEVQLESPAKLEEAGLTENSTGFNDITVTDNVQTGTSLQVQLVGVFETINSRAAHVRIQLAEGTDVQSLLLNAAATVLGQGIIHTARINSSGTTMSSRPENMVVNDRCTVSLQDESGNTTETISHSYSNATSSEITGIKLNTNSIKVNMSNFVANLGTEDFKVSSKLDGQDYTLQNLRYNANTQRFTFDPVSLEGNVGKILQVAVGTTPGAVTLTGTDKSDEITVQNGFTGRITDVQEAGISGVTIKFRAAAASNDGEVLATAETDEDGYYTAYLAPGEYTGEISGTGVVKTYMPATSSNVTFKTGQDATAIRATGMDSIKIVLTWGERPYDEDSHLEGPTVDGNGKFHTWYGNKIYAGQDGIKYADLDWDDTSSYGPETTTIYKLVDGKYKFYVHNFSRTPSLVGSGAKVEVYKGNSVTPINTFTIPDDTRNQNALYWFVFNMNVSGNGETVDVSPINELRYDTNSTLKIASSAETSYAVSYGSIQGVPAGTVADLKADLSAYDGGALKVLAAGTNVYDAASFDAATDLPDSTALVSGQIVSVKAQDSIVTNYTINLVGENPLLVSDYLTQHNSSTTSSAVTLTWDKATDNVTPQNQLEYSLYMSENAPQSNINNWETYGTLLTRTNDINSYEVIGLNNTLPYYFQLIVKDADGNKTAYATAYRFPSTNQNPVLISDYLTQHNSSTTSSAVKLTWDKATDNVTPQSNLKYSLYMSEDEEFGDNIEEWEINARPLTATNDIDSFEVTGLSDTINYHFKLIVEDTDGNKTAYATEYRSFSPMLDSEFLAQSESTTPGAVTLTWDKAKDNTTPQNNLKYSLYMSQDTEYGNNINSWENNATLLTQDTDIDNFEVTGLSDTINYYFKLIVEDADGNKTFYRTEHRHFQSI